MFVNVKDISWIHAQTDGHNENEMSKAEMLPVANSVFSLTPICIKRQPYDMSLSSILYRVAKILDHFFKCITAVQNDVEKRSVYQSVH